MDTGQYESSALVAKEIVWEIDDGTTAGFQVVSELIDLTPPNQQIEDVEVTHYMSPGNQREYRAGYSDPGEASLQINWVPGSATDQLIRALKADGTLASHRITWPNGATWTFSGYVKGFEPASPLGDRLTATVTMRISGDTSYTDPV